MTLIIVSLLCARHFAEGFACIISFKPLDNSLMWDYNLYFTDEETEAHGDEKPCPKSHS